MKTEITVRRVIKIDDKNYTLENGDLRLSLTADADFLLKQIEGLSSGRRWLTQLGPETGLWCLTFRGPDGTSPAYRSGNAAFEGVREISGEAGAPTTALRASWRVPLSPTAAARVEVEVALDAATSLSQWRLFVAVPKAWSLTKSEFPTFDGFSLDGELHALTPQGWGVDCPFEGGYVYEGDYPSCLASMQWLAIRNQTHGLYLATHDPRAFLKTFHLTTATQSGLFKVVAVPPIAEGGGDDVWTEPFPYPTMLGVFTGGVIEGGRLYREFAHQTPWGEAAAWSRRSTPQWLKETDIWLRPDGSPEINLEKTREAVTYFGPEHTALHWYRWHEIPYDTNYPEYLPELPGFKEAIAEMQTMGTRVMPYINGRLWDPASRSWREEGASASAARRDTGDCYTEVYGSKVPNNVMCPATDQWQAKVTDVVDSLFRELKVNGVYIDQIGAAAGVPCHAANHPHAPGGGSFWHDGYRELLTSVRSVMAPDTMITTEENAECWIDQIDALLVVNTNSLLGQPAPMFPAVYADRTITFGFMYYPATEPDNSLAFRLKNARAFLWGAQIGWIQPTRLMTDPNMATAAFLRELADCRAHARNVLWGGTLEALLEPAPDTPRQRGRGTGSFGGSYPIDIEAAQATLWRAADGTLMVLAINLADSPMTARFPMPPHAVLPAGWAVADCASGRAARVKAEREGDDLVLEMPPASAAAVRLSHP